MVQLSTNLPTNMEYTMTVVQTETMETFIKCIYEFTKLGLTFKANADQLTITLTGGY